MDYFIRLFKRKFKVLHKMETFRIRYFARNDMTVRFHISRGSSTDKSAAGAALPQPRGVRCNTAAADIARVRFNAKRICVRFIRDESRRWKMRNSIAENTAITDTKARRIARPRYCAMIARRAWPCSCTVPRLCRVATDAAALRAAREKWSHEMPARPCDYGLSQRGSRNHAA